MKIAAAIARFVLGLVFVVFGLNGFLNFMPMGPVPALAGQFAGALIQSHYMVVVLTLEILSGVLLLTNSYALLATTFIAPVIASKPVAKTMMSTGYSASAVQIPASEIRRMGVAFTSTSETLGRLKVSK